MSDQEPVQITLTREQAYGAAEVLDDIARQERRCQRGVQPEGVRLAYGALLQIEGLAYQLRQSAIAAQLKAQGEGE